MSTSSPNTKTSIDTKSPSSNARKGLPDPPPTHPDQKMPGAMPESKPTPGPSDQGQDPYQPQHARNGGILQRAFSKKNRKTATRFFSAYAQTWVGLSPIWLMGEAVTPGAKVGTQFKKGKGRLVDVAADVREMVVTSSKDVVVIVDEKLRGTGDGSKQVAERTAEVIKAAGEHAILVVTSSMEKLSSQFAESKGEGSSKGKAKSQAFDLKAFASDPNLKRTLNKHGRDALVLLDQGLKHPVVVTGVSRFAKSKGIPHADALLRLASLGLGKILRVLPEDMQEAVGEAAEAKIEEIDAEELERASTNDERQEAEDMGKTSEKAPSPKVEEGEGDPYAEMRRKNDCIIM